MVSQDYNDEQDKRQKARGQAGPKGQKVKAPRLLVQTVLECYFLVSGITTPYPGRQWFTLDTLVQW